ncbi:hypothetical protein [Salinicola aestuarinus]|uniref:hypothetical protein n=1 Tax=Salinicola aestuarinus TaxID=1949082 RepID=UPI000DA1F1CC|nr:hypothetical protein [Salinicola aestuarinus]
MKTQSSRLGAIVLFVASLVGFAIALYAYLTPLTGVNGSLGALVVTLACLLLALLALLLVAAKGRGGRVVCRVVILLGLAGTGFAALLLHQWWITVAMVVGLIGLIIDMNRPTPSHRPAHS